MYLQTLFLCWSGKVAAFHTTSTLATSLKGCKENCFPNFYVLLKTGCTVPVTLCEFERSSSAMQRLQTWLRISMASQRLSAVAFMGIHRNHGLNYTEMVKKFFLHPRKFDFF